jgi:hypothetical protein
MSTSMNATEFLAFVEREADVALPTPCGPCRRRSRRSASGSRKEFSDTVAQLPDDYRALLARP